MSVRIYKIIVVALSIVGSATSLFSCASEEVKQSASKPQESLMTEFSEDLTIEMSQNGRPSYTFTTPLVEGYSLAREPYREFRKGVNITTYQDDSLRVWDSKLRANYAIYYEDRELWEAKGDVEVHKHDGKILYTQQLFWNAKTDKIYSNVDSRVVNTTNGDRYKGEGFESDQEFHDWTLRSSLMRIEVDFSPSDSTSMSGADSTKMSQPTTKDNKGYDRPYARPTPTPTRPTPRPSSPQNQNNHSIAPQSLEVDARAKATTSATSNATSRLKIMDADDIK